MGELVRKYGLPEDTTFRWGVVDGVRVAQLRYVRWHEVRVRVGHLQPVRVGGVLRWHAYTASQGHIGLFDSLTAARGAVACWVGADLRAGRLAFGGRV